MKIGIVTTNTPERQRMFMEHAYPEMEISVTAASAPEEEIIAACADAEAVIMNAPGISTAFLKDCPNVKLLQSTFTGYDHVDIKSINDMGIAFANNGGGNAIPVAEFTMGLINGVTRGVFRSVQNARAGNWNSGLREHPTWELTGKCVGIIDMGAIGQRVAQILTGYECDTVHTKRARVSAEREKELHARYLPLDELLQVADYVTIHTALNQSRRGMIGKEQLALMKPTAFIINTTRGAVIDQEALYEALTTGGIAGAALDVLAEEPTPQEHPIWQLDNVIITPHVSGSSQESGARSAAFSFDNVRRAVLGEPIQSLITPE